MGATKKYMVQMREEEYLEIDFELRQRFISDKVIFDDYSEYKDNKQFKVLYKAKKKADKDLRDWKYNQRHNN